MKNVYVLIALCLCLVLSACGSSGITAPANKTTAVEEIPSEPVPYDPSLSPDTQVEITLTSCEEVYETCSTETVTIRAGSTRMTNDIYHTYAYAYCTDINGNEVVLCFSHGFNPTANPADNYIANRSDFLVSVRVFLETIENAGEDGVTVTGVTTKIDAVHEQSFIDASLFGPVGDIGSMKEMVDILQDISDRVLVAPDWSVWHG